MSRVRGKLTACVDSEGLFHGAELRDGGMRISHAKAPEILVTPISAQSSMIHVA